jgi:MoaA/NifB/PqqE/SkfB family radical SAM enzyme
MLDVMLLCQAVDDAAAAGYNWLSVSGGEPLLYGGLPTLLRHAKSRGLNTAVTSNGLLWTGHRLERFAELTDLLVISIDGVPASHDRIRNRSGAFATITRRLNEIRQHGMTFGFIFTLTQFNLHELPWVADFAVQQGARLLQVHPLEATGEAAHKLPGAVPDHTEAAYAWLLARQLESGLSGRLPIQVDVVFSDAVKNHPERFYATASAAPLQKVSPLIIEHDGTVVPLHYGFPRRYALGNLHDAPLHRLFERWHRQVAPSFGAVCRAVHERSTTTAQPHFFDWYAAVAATAAGEPMDVQNHLTTSAGERLADEATVRAPAPL